MSKHFIVLTFETLGSSSLSLEDLMEGRIVPKRLYIS